MHDLTHHGLGEPVVVPRVEQALVQPSRVMEAVVDGVADDSPMYVSGAIYSPRLRSSASRTGLTSGKMPSGRVIMRR